jgi:hypothetical protein
MLRAICSSEHVSFQGIGKEGCDTETSIVGSDKLGVVVMTPQHRDRGHANAISRPVLENYYSNLCKFSLHITFE